MKNWEWKCTIELIFVVFVFIFICFFSSLHWMLYKIRCDDFSSRLCLFYFRCEKKKKQNTMPMNDTKQNQIYFCWLISENCLYEMRAKMFGVSIKTDIHCMHFVNPFWFHFPHYSFIFYSFFFVDQHIFKWKFSNRWWMKLRSKKEKKGPKNQKTNLGVCLAFCFCYCFYFRFNNEKVKSKKRKKT